MNTEIYVQKYRLVFLTLLSFWLNFLWKKNRFSGIGGNYRVATIAGDKYGLGISKKKNEFEY